jgi:hypothetical protein
MRRLAIERSQWRQNEWLAIWLVQFPTIPNNALLSALAFMIALTG